jgi:hypothetical protein
MLFRENDIDETVLPNLTADDLKELGIASLGHRRKLLDAIAALRSDAGGGSASQPRSDQLLNCNEDAMPWVRRSRSSRLTFGQ